MILRLYIFLFIFGCFLPTLATAAKLQAIQVEKIIDSSTFIASGQRVHLWGVKAIPPNNKYALISRLYLATMLKRGNLSCIEIKNSKNTSHCRIDDGDVGSLLVQMGMAIADSPYYKGEETIAQSKMRGVWKTGGTQL